MVQGSSSIKLIRVASHVWCAAFAIFGIAIPLAALFSRVDGLGALFDESVLSLVRVTLKQATLSVLLSASIGLPLGLWAGRIRGSGIDALLAIPFAVPTLVAAAAWTTILGVHGYSLGAVVLAHAAINAPWIALLVARARREVPQGAIDAARSLGANRLARARLLTWPWISPAFFGACLQVFSLAAMSFVLVLILGGGPPVETLETAIYSRVRMSGLDLANASACAIWQLLITAVPWVLYLRFGRTQNLMTVESQARPVKRSDSWLASVVCALFLLPYLAVFDSRVLELGFWTEIAGPFTLSLRLAVVSSALALLSALAGIIARRKLIPAIPAGISALVLGLGGYLAYRRWIDPFEGSFAAIAVLQAVLFTPLAHRVLWSVAEFSPTRLKEAAATLGGSPWQVFFAVEWPRYRAPVFAAFGLVGATVLGEVAAVSLFYSENLIPLSLQVSRWMSQYRFDDAQAAASVLFIAAALAIFAATIVNRGTER